MFVDRVELEVAAGNGGNGIIAWRREKYIPKGGPAGGDGGRGGSVRIVVDPNTCGLESFRHVKKVIAEHGQKGGGSCSKGKDGEDALLKIPPGTVVRDRLTQEVLFDGVTYHDEFIVCQGGKGGKGNARFKSPTNRAPYISTDGEEGETRSVEFELKLIGDVGLVGFPNAGKSTLFSKLTYHVVPTAPYPFTTLTPNLGYVGFDGGFRVLLTDIPGIIEGAHQNKGLGLEFLRHIERTKVLMFVLDAAGSDGRDPLSDYHVLLEELRSYDPELLQRPSCIILNKTDLDEAKDNAAKFRSSVKKVPVFEVSAELEDGFEPVKAHIETLLRGMSS
jgi:GTP-binding protein